MAMRAHDLWTWRGAMTRTDYAKWGLLLFAIKYTIDWIVAHTWFDFVLYPWNYLFGQPWGPLPSDSPVTHVNAPLLPFVLLALSLPYIVVGVGMTLRRLRDAGWPGALVALFFIPFLNLLLFALLVALPTQTSRDESRTAAIPTPPTGRSPGGLLVSALLGIGASVALGTAMLALATMVLREYGWGVFVAMPFMMGFFGVLCFSRDCERSVKECLAVSLVSVALVAVALLVFAMEGALCIAMAAPIAMALATLGGLAGWLVQRERWSRRTRPAALYGCAWLVLPVLLTLESHAPIEPTIVAATTSCEIKAPAHVVWRHVIAFSDLPPPTESIFLAGIAHPVRARIDGGGVGAVRHCEFSTGPFVEPITAWEENSRLAFDVTSQPDPMQEWSPYGRIRPAHLESFFRSRRGEFRLVPLGEGRIRLEGTTWYQQDIWPARYWRVWSDLLIHRIHLRVLQHIKAEAERDVAARGATATSPHLPASARETSAPLSSNR